MGVFDTIHIESGVDWPDDCPLEPDEQTWQSKTLGNPSMQSYKITSEGRLLRLERSSRPKTESEKQREATKWGFDSWEQYVEAYDECDGLIPDSINHDDMDETPPVARPIEQTIDEEWWEDHNMHGTFEFHHSEVWGESYYSLEARFTKGDLDDIVLLNIKK